MADQTDTTQPTTSAQPALWTFTYVPPGALHSRTLDCFAATKDDALRSARRFIARENRRLAKARIATRIRTPQAHTLVNETAKWAAIAAAEGR